MCLKHYLYDTSCWLFVVVVLLLFLCVYVYVCVCLRASRTDAPNYFISTLMFLLGKFIQCAAGMRRPLSKSSKPWSKKSLSLFKRLKR